MPTKALSWDETGKRFYETGVDHGVLYLYNTKDKKYKPGVAWNGLTSVNETPSGAEKTDLYADNIKYLNMRSAEDFGLTLNCYTYPDEWMACDGSAFAKNQDADVPGVVIGQQSRKVFGLSYRTKKGNDVEGNDAGYKLHLVYGCTASPSERSYTTVNDSPEAIEFNYDIATTPVSVEGFQPTALITIDSTALGENSGNLEALEKVLYGSDTEGEGILPQLPTPDEVVKIITTGMIDSYQEAGE